VGEGIAGHVVEIGEAVLAENIETDPRFAKLNDPTYGSGSFISLPLKVGQQIIGVINLAGKTSVLAGASGQPAFSGTDLQFLNTLTTHIAYAVENARLLEEARRSAEKLQQVVEDQKLRLTLAQQQMVQAAKLAALGQLVAGVAHELNNPLTVLLANTKSSMKTSPTCSRERRRPAAREAPADGRGGGKRPADRARLTDVCRRLPLDRQRLELAELVNKVLSVAAPDLKLARIKVHKEMEPDVPPSGRTVISSGKSC